MKKLFIVLASLSLLILFISSNRESSATADSDKLIELIEITPWYNQLTDSAGLSKGALYAAYQKFIELKSKNFLKNDSLLTIIDYSKPSCDERLYIIDVKNQQLILHSLVAHGQKSGVLFAEKFSNRPQSHMSSLGMYLTSETYLGKHGYSLRLNGLEEGINSNARKRAIVVHGANYVSNSYIKQNGRIGRSFGCPALPSELSAQVIDLIKGGSFFYIYHPSVLN
jgi:hypothetical protein